MLLARRLRKRSIDETTTAITMSKFNIIEDPSIGIVPMPLSLDPNQLVLPAINITLNMSLASDVSVNTPVLTPMTIPQLPGFLFTFDYGVPITFTAQGDARLSERLVCVSFNVFFDRCTQDERADYALNLFVDLAPDVIAVQELTVAFTERMRAHALFSAIYAITCDVVLGSYCTAICVKRNLLPCVQRVFEAAPPTRMGRLIPVVVFRGPDGEPFSVAGVHLESNDGSPTNDELRAGQLQYLATDGPGAPLAPSAFIMGDTNFSKTGDGHARAGGSDVSPHPNTTATYEAMLQAGWADDDTGGEHTLTPMRPTGHSEGRVDIGLRRGCAYTHTTVSRYASKPIRDGEPPVYASDHLLMLFELF